MKGNNNNQVFVWIAIISFIHSFIFGWALAHFLLDSLFLDMICMLMVPSTPPSPMLVPLQSFALIVFNSILLFRLKQHEHNRIEFESIRFWRVHSNGQGTDTHTQSSAIMHRHIDNRFYLYLFVHCTAFRSNSKN